MKRVLAWDGWLDLSDVVSSSFVVSFTSPQEWSGAPAFTWVGPCRWAGPWPTACEAFQPESQDAYSYRADSGAWEADDQALREMIRARNRFRSVLLWFMMQGWQPDDTEQIVNRIALDRLWICTCKRTVAHPGHFRKPKQGECNGKIPQDWHD